MGEGVENKRVPLGQLVSDSATTGEFKRRFNAERTNVASRASRNWKGQRNSSIVALVATMVVALLATTSAVAAQDGDAQCLGLDATIVLVEPGLAQGTDGDDVIVGSAGDDVIRAGAGNDIVCAGAGDDTVLGSTGNDTILGEGGNDDLVGGPDGDEVFGGDGADRIRAGRGADLAWGDDGDDEISGGQGEDVVRGGNGNDLLRGGVGADDVRGGAGNDRVAGGNANDTVRGGDGNDDLVGGNGPSDVLIGGGGADACTDRGTNTTRQGCEFEVSPDIEPISPVDTAAPEPDVERVIHVSIDGLRSDHVTTELTPVLMMLMADGASTLNARTDPAVTRTLPNHTSQLTGRFVFGQGGHGVEFNEDDGGTVHETAGVYVPSVFDVVHDNGGTTILYARKEKFDFLERSYSSGGAADVTGTDDGTDKLDVYERDAPVDAVEPFLLDVVDAEDSATYGFFHIRLPDEFGHLFNWGSREYVQSVRDSDQLVGQLVEGLAEAGLLESTAFIITSDHGGPLGDTSHAGVGNAGNYTIPFIAWGPGIGEGIDLYDANDGGGEYADPGTDQVDRDGAQPIRGHDAANLGLDLLDLPALPAPAANSTHTLLVTSAQLLRR